MRNVKVEVVVRVQDDATDEDIESEFYDLLEPTYPDVYISIPVSAS